MSENTNPERSSEKIKRLFYEKSKRASDQNTETHRADLDDLAIEIGDAFDWLTDILNHVPLVPDNVLLASTMNWGALNTLVSAVELFRLGYSKEPMMLVRNAVETACVAYAMLIDKETHQRFMADPEGFDSQAATDAVSGASLFAMWYTDSNSLIP